MIRSCESKLMRRLGQLEGYLSLHSLSEKDFRDGAVDLLNVAYKLNKERASRGAEAVSVTITPRPDTPEP